MLCEKILSCLKQRILLHSINKSNGTTSINTYFLVHFMDTRWLLKMSKSIELHVPVFDKMLLGGGPMKIMLYPPLHLDLYGQGGNRVWHFMSSIMNCCHEEAGTVGQLCRHFSHTMKTDNWGLAHQANGTKGLHASFIWSNGHKP